ncbi:MAG: hypothetical protein IT342_18090 [Candidatus Melainabacteria bacterium]|nr:hypothetical protein [Candidatus Melainabacteria bacterium]
MVLVALFLLVVVFSFFLNTSTTDRAFRRGDDRLMELFDSGVYLNSARTINKINAENEINKKARRKELADMLILDGPVLPYMIARILLLAKQAQASELLSVALFESVIQAILTALVFILSARVTGNKFLALAAAVVWAVYPPAVMATQRLVMENLSSVFLLALILCFDWTLSYGEKNNRHLFTLAVAAIFFALILLTKPVLLFSALLPFSFVLLYLRSQRARSGFLIFAFVSAMALLPFWIYTFEATGKVCFTPQRIPTFNALVGNNLDTDGLQGLPQGRVSDHIAKSPNLAFVELSLFLEDPIAHTDLNIRKLPRIFAEPWNDFRRAAILPDAISIRLAHQLLGAFEMAAVVMAFAVTVSSLKSCTRKGFDSSQKTVVEAGKKVAQTVSLIFLALAGHLIYLTFEGIPRYGFTAAPLLLILAFWLIKQMIEARLSLLYGLNLALPAILLGLLSNFGRLQRVLTWIGSPTLACILLAVVYIALAVWLMRALNRISQSCFNFADRRLIKVIFAISTVLFLITITLSIIRERINSDLVVNLSGPVKATREIDLTEAQLNKTKKKIDWALLLIDSEKEIAQSHISVNGHKIHELPGSVYNYYQKKYDLLAFLEELATDIKMKAEDVRQWRAVPIPVDYLKLDAINKISLGTPAAVPLTIYGDYSETEADPFCPAASLPTFEHLSHSRIFTDASCVDWRPRIKYLTKCPSRSYIEQNEPRHPLPANPDLHSAPGVQNGRFRILLAVGLVDDNTTPNFTSETKSLPLNLLSFTGSKNENKEPVLSKGPKGNLLIGQSCRANYQLNTGQKATHIVVELRGKARLQVGEGRQAVVRISLSGPEDANGTTTKYSASDYDCKGQPKPTSICLPSALQMLTLNAANTTPISLKAVYPLNVVRGRGDHLSVEIMPVPSGTPVKIEEAELTVREITWPDLGRGTIFVY